MGVRSEGGIKGSMEGKKKEGKSLSPTPAVGVAAKGLASGHCQEEDEWQSQESANTVKHVHKLKGLRVSGTEKGDTQVSRKLAVFYKGCTHINGSQQTTEEPISKPDCASHRCRGLQALEQGCREF